MALSQSSTEKSLTLNPDEFLSAITIMLKNLPANLCSDLNPSNQMTKPTLEEFLKSSNNKFFRGKLVVMTYNAFTPGNLVDIEKPHTLGWVIEIIHSACRLTENMTIMREDLPTVNMTAINDFFVAASFAFKILKEQFQDLPCYQQLYDKLVEVVDLTSKGLTLDCLTGFSPDDILRRYTMDRYNTLARYKNNYYTFYAPVALGIILAGKSDDLKLMASVKQLTLKIGHYFQVRADYMNCFGNPEKTGKVGTDIEGNRLTWLFVKAAQLANPTQLQELVDNYGKWDKHCVDNIRKVYIDVGVKEEFEHFEGHILEEIKDMAVELEKVSVNGSLGAAFFLNILKKLNMTDA